MKLSKTPSPYYIAAELVALFVILPLLYAFDVLPFHKVIPLVILFLYCSAVLFRHKQIHSGKFTIDTDW